MQKWLLLGAICCVMINSTIGQTLTDLENRLIEIDQEKADVKQKIEDIKLNNIRENLLKVSYPVGDEKIEVVEHLAMVLGYSEKHEQAAWVMHMVLPDVAEGNVSRTNDFREDELVSTGTAVTEDYWYSGYDRGHLAPSADFRWSQRALSESYFYSNMSPQLPELNRESWAELENLIREYVVENNEELYVVTGPVLRDDLPKMQNEGRKNEVSIPSLFYKVVLDISGEEKRGVAFLMKNGVNSKPILTYAVSIDSLESLTGLNFFPNLEIDEIEKEFDVNGWRTEEMKGEVLPMNPTTLPKGKINTIAAKYNIGERACVCGTVVSTKFSEKSSATFLNLDKKFPNQIFSVTIWGDNLKNFSYLPADELLNKKVCITGKVEDKDGTPTVNVTSEKAIEILE